MGWKTVMRHSDLTWTLSQVQPDTGRGILPEEEGPGQRHSPGTFQRNNLFMCPKGAEGGSAHYHQGSRLWPDRPGCESSEMGSSSCEV